MQRAAKHAHSKTQDRKSCRGIGDHDGVAGVHDEVKTLPRKNQNRKLGRRPSLSVKTEGHEEEATGPEANARPDNPDGT